MKKDNKEKIEVWLHKNQKKRLKEISIQKGCSLAELLRRGIELLEAKYDKQPTNKN